MLTTFMLQVAAGGVLRLGLHWAIKRRFHLRLHCPDWLAIVLLVLAAIPDLLKPIWYPVPLGITLGAVLPDLILRRA